MMHSKSSCHSKGNISNTRSDSKLTYFLRSLADVIRWSHRQTLAYYARACWELDHRQRTYPQKGTHFGAVQ